MNTRVALLLLGAVALASANPVLPGRTPQIVEAVPELLVEYLPEAPVVSIINPVHVDEFVPEKRPVIGFKEPVGVPEILIEVLPEEPLPELLVEALPEEIVLPGRIPQVVPEVPEILIEVLPEEPLPELLVEALPEEPVISIINPIHVEELVPEKRPVVGFKEPAGVPENLVEVLPEEPLPELLIEALPEEVPQIGVLPPVHVPEILIEAVPDQVPAQIGVKPGSRPIPVDIIF